MYCRCKCNVALQRVKLRTVPSWLWMLSRISCMPFLKASFSVVISRSLPSSWTMSWFSLSNLISCCCIPSDSSTVRPCWSPCEGTRAPISILWPRLLSCDGILVSTSSVVLMSGCCPRDWTCRLSLPSRLFSLWFCNQNYHSICMPTSTCLSCKSKVKQSHYMPWRRLGEEEIHLLLIHDLGTRWGWVVSVTPRPHFTPRERTTSTHCTGGWVGPRADLDTEARVKILSPLLRIEPRSPSSQTLYWLSYPH
jgi:hypothetical protein